MDLRWHKREEFAKLSSEAKNELQACQNTAEVKVVVKASRDAYFNSKSTHGDNKRSGYTHEGGNKNKLRRQISALQKQVDEQSQITEISAALNEDFGSSSNTTVDEISISMARKVMKIIGREKKTKSS